MLTPPYEDGLSGPVAPMDEDQRRAIAALLVAPACTWEWYRLLPRMQAVHQVYGYWLYQHNDIPVGCTLRCFNHPEDIIRFLREEGAP